MGMIKLKLLVEQATGKKMCGNCEYFVPDTDECSLLDPPDVRAEGTCDLWEGGHQSTSDETTLKRSTTKADANYTNSYWDHPWNKEQGD